MNSAKPIRSTHCARPRPFVRYLRLALPGLLWAPLVLACSTEDPAGEVSNGTGTVQLALLRELPSGVRYRLTQADVEFDGPESTSVNIDGDMDILRVELRNGSYRGRLLDGWQMQRQLPGDAFESIDAQLRSMQPQNIEVLRDQVTRVALVFDVEGAEVSFGFGAVDIVLELNEIAVDAGAVQPSCGNGVVELGEECDNGGGDSETCSAECREWDLPPMPSELPDTPLVYVARSNVQARGARFDGVPYGAPAVLVLGVYPQRPCVGASGLCTTAMHSLGSQSPAARVRGYVTVGEVTYPLSAETTGYMNVVNDYGVLLEEGFSTNLNWEQATPEPMQLYLHAGANTRGNVAGLTSVALPRDLSGLQMDWNFDIEDLTGNSDLFALNSEWTVIDNGAHCGDGVVAPGVETCDDGNSVSGDGCNADCLWELRPPDLEGYWHTIYGHSSVSLGGVSRGDPMLFTAGVPAAGSCSDGICSYPAQELTFLIGNTVWNQSGEWLTSYDTPAWDEVRVGGGEAYAYAYDGSGAALAGAAMPGEDFDVKRFPTAYMQVDLGVDSVGGDVESWTVSYTYCSHGTCSCAPAPCPDEPLCGIFPDGCGGHAQCACTNSSCVDGICQTP